MDTIAASPCLVTDRNECGCEPARTASTAIWTLPSVPFLKPTGIESPEASSRWTWLSVVRAPMAPQLTRSAMNWGVMVSRNSQPAGDPHAGEVQEQPAGDAEPLVDGEAPVEARDR